MTSLFVVCRKKIGIWLFSSEPGLVCKLQAARNCMHGHDLERVFLLDDDDQALIERRRGEHMKLGFSLQLVSVRWVGTVPGGPAGGSGGGAGLHGRVVGDR